MLYRRGAVSAPARFYQIYSGRKGVPYDETVDLMRFFGVLGVLDDPLVLCDFTEDRKGLSYGVAVDIIIQSRRRPDILHSALKFPSCILWISFICRRDDTCGKVGC